jgi:GntR family transcriptional regulator
MDERYLAAGESLYRLLSERYGLRDEYSEQSLEVDKPSAIERDALKLAPRDHVVRIRGVSFTAEGKAFDCYRQSYRASDFVFYTAGSRNRRLLQPADIGEWVVQSLVPQGAAASPAVKARGGARRS